MTMEELRTWLGSRDFRFATNPTWERSNACNWYAYRRSDLDARPCECNEKPRMQLVVYPFELDFNGTRHSSVEVEVCGEAGGTWYKLRAYGMSTEDIPAKLHEVEGSLIAAWNALLPAEVTT